MTICRMQSEDLEAVANLASQLGYPCSIEDIRNIFKNIQNEPDYGLFVAKSEGGAIAGYIQVNVEPKTLLSGPRADVAALVVSERVRGNGIGKALLKEAEKWVKENGLSKVRIRSNIKREASHQFYQKNGYVVDKSSHVFIKSV